MTLNVSFIENLININKEYITSIEIENKKLFYRFVELLNKYSKDEIEEEIFQEKTTIKVIIDFFNLDCNNKKTINNINKIIHQNTSEENKLEINKCYNKLISIYNSIIKDTDMPLTIDMEINIENLIKLLNIKIINENDILKNLLNLIDTLKNTKECDILIFINLKQYLEKEELIEFYKYAIYNGISIIILDSQSYGIPLENEKKLIIDKNLEEFML